MIHLPSCVFLFSPSGSGILFLFTFPCCLTIESLVLVHLSLDLSTIFIEQRISRREEEEEEEE